MFKRGPNSSNKAILSMQRLRNVKTVSFGGGQIMVSEPLGGALAPFPPWIRLCIDSSSTL